MSIETGELLRRERERRSLTQAELGRLLGVSMRSVGDWERDGVPKGRYPLINELLGLQLARPAPQQPQEQHTSSQEFIHSEEPPERPGENVVFVIGLPVRKADLGQAELEEIEAGTRAVALRLLREIRSKQ